MKFWVVSILYLLVGFYVVLVVSAGAWLFVPVPLAGVLMIALWAGHIPEDFESAAYMSLSLGTLLLSAWLLYIGLRRGFASTIIWGTLGILFGLSVLVLERRKPLD